MADQEFQASNQKDAAQIAATLLQQYQDIATQLAKSRTSEAAQAALEPIQSQDATVQIAFLKALAQKKTVEAANITQAIHTLSPNKEVRKEARRRLIQLEGSDTYATWSLEAMNTFSQALESISKGGHKHGHEHGEPPAPIDTFLSSLDSLFSQEGVIDDVPSYQETVEVFLEASSNNEFVDAYELLSEESSVKEGLEIDDWAEKREDWVRATDPTDLQIMFVHSNDEEPDEDSEQPVSVTVGMSIELTDPQPLAEWPKATLSLPQTRRHWYLLRYTLVPEDDDWLIQSVTNEASTIATLPAEEILQRIHSNEDVFEQIRKRIAEGMQADEDDEDDLVEEDDHLDIKFNPSGPGAGTTVVDATLVQADEKNSIIETEFVDAVPVDEDDEDEEDEAEDFETVSEILNSSLDDMDAMIRLAVENLHYYDALFAQDPKKYAQYYKVAFAVASTTHDIERAIVYAQQASVHETEERGLALNNLALSYQELAQKYHEEDEHDKEKSIDDLVEPTLRQALEVDESPINLAALAMTIFLHSGDLEEAEALFVKAQKGPLSPELTINIETGLGEIAVENEEFQKALKHFQTLIKLVPDNGQIWYRLGYLHHQLEHFNEAINALKHSIELDPELTEPYTELASLYTSQGDIMLARTIVRQGLEANPEAADLYATEALIYMHSGDLKTAHKRLSEAESLDDQDEFVQEARQRYNLEIKRRPAQPKSQQKPKQHKAKKR
jgi:tetratricopeptide (TPR) repeat protein